MQDTLPIHFAPLQGYTEAFYRNAHAKYFGGVDTYYTPFVRLERGDPRRRDVRGIEPEENKVPHLIPQLIASSAEKAEVILSLFIEKGYREADINLGCPFPLLARRHNGSGILPYPEEVKALLSIVTRYPQISFSVKMRLGWEQPDECGSGSYIERPAFAPNHHASPSGQTRIQRRSRLGRLLSFPGGLPASACLQW